MLLSGSVKSTSLNTWDADFTGILINISMKSVADCMRLQEIPDCILRKNNCTVQVF